ncbi:uncharacterized protein [Diabrotica undecimpunctata]|uniref:uncharacterized protein n=1 Tax=Diabrotica undecimpunctata TaxID=50387 RepID=UPI003B63FE32
MEKNFIKVLKINGIYWIPAEKLRNFILSLNNLEELQVIDTKLGFSIQILKHIKSYSLVKKRKISSSILSAFGYLPNFKNLQRLSMVTLPLLSGSFFPKLFQECTQLKSLNFEMRAPNVPFMTN